MKNAQRKKSGSDKINLIFRFLKPSAFAFLLTILSSIAHTVFDGLIPQVIRFTVDELIGGKTSDVPAYIRRILNAAVLDRSELLNSRLFFIGAIVLTIALISALMRYISRVSNTKGSEIYAKSMKDALFAHIQKLPFSWHTKNNTGDIIQRCTSDVDMVRNFVANQLIDIFSIVFNVIFALWMMFSMNGTIATAALLFIPIVFCYSFFFYSKIKDKFKEADEAEGVLSTVAQENLTGVRVVRAFGRESYEKDKFERANVKYTDLWADVGGLMGWFWGLGDLVSCFQMLTVVVFCVFQAAGGNVSPGDCIAFISYNTMLMWPVRSLARKVAEMSKAGVSIDRLDYILSSDPETETAHADVDFTGDIEFKNVSFSYASMLSEEAKKDESVKPEVLEDVSFKIKGGTTFGIMGGTGSGKSTLMHLLCRLYDIGDSPENAGQITINDTDIKTIDYSELRSSIGIVLQEPFLFSRTIAENIAICGASRGEANAYIDEIRRAADSACVDGSISEFTDGYDTMVGERGVTLSGGQKQRVAIARMLMRKTPIVILDDSLSAVDTETDSKIRAALRAKLSGVTVIIISHRITTLMNADNIMVLDGGKVAQTGTHAELIASEGIYREIYNIQQF